MAVSVDDAYYINVFEMVSGIGHSNNHPEPFHLVQVDGPGTTSAISGLSNVSFVRIVDVIDPLDSRNFYFATEVVVFLFVDVDRMVLVSDYPSFCGPGIGLLNKGLNSKEIVWICI